MQWEYLKSSWLETRLFLISILSFIRPHFQKHSLYLHTPYQCKHSHLYNFLGVFFSHLRHLLQTHNVYKTAWNAGFSRFHSLYQRYGLHMCRCWGCIIVSKELCNRHWSVDIGFLVKSLRNTNDWSGNHSFYTRNQWSHKINLKNFIKMVMGGDRENYRLFLCEKSRKEELWTLTISIIEKPRDLIF